MTISKTIQSIVILACSILFISPAAAVPTLGGQSTGTPKTGPSFGGGRKTVNCKRTVYSGYVSSSSQSWAIYGAKHVWKRKATRRHGKAYSFWGFSRNQQTACKKNSGKYLCKVAAHPCNGGNIMKR